MTPRDGLLRTFDCVPPQVRETLSGMLRFHRREAKPQWWRRYEWIARPPAELVAELSRRYITLYETITGKAFPLPAVGAGGASYEEAAVITGCAIGTVKSRLARGRVALAALINGPDEAVLNKPVRSKPVRNSLPKHPNPTPSM